MCVILFYLSPFFFVLSLSISLSFIKTVSTTFESFVSLALYDFEDSSRPHTLRSRTFREGELRFVEKSTISNGGR